MRRFRAKLFLLSAVICMTGTRDCSPIRPEMTPERRREVYAALPPGDAYEVIFKDGAHSIFGQYRENDPKYHRAIAALTTRFLDAYLRGDKEARAQLRSKALPENLEPEDEWNWK